MKNLTTISSDLFHKLRGTFTDIKIGDEEGRVTTDPSVARFFDVNYSVKGTDLGRVNIKIDDDSLTVIYSDSMFDDAEVGKSQWYDFLKNLRQFAKRNMLRFDTRDITKSNLDQRDYQYLAQESGEKNMSESKLFGTSKTSYQDMGEAKIIVKHSAPVNYNNPAGRTQRIESIYIESSAGERFRYPHKHLNGARAMARHVANGGTVYDGIGSYISGLSEELGKLKQFKNYSNRSGVMSETLNDLTQRVIQRMEQVKNEIRSLQNQTAYEQFSSAFKPQAAVEVPEDIRTKWVDELTIKSFNEELTSVFPYLYKLVSEKQAQELTYDDFVDETIEENSSSKEVNHLEDFERQLDDITTFDYDIAESEEDQDLEEEPKQVMPKEVVEFIASMYDRNTGTFPKGEEGVKIAVEKRFGEQAGQFANFVVEKLSAKSSTQAETSMVENDAEGSADLLAAVEEEINNPGRHTDNLRDVLNATFGSSKDRGFEKARAVIGKYLDLIDNASVGSPDDGIEPMSGGNIAQFIQEYDLTDYLQHAAAMLDKIVGTGEGMEEGWGSDEYHLFQNGYTIVQKKQTARPGEPGFLLYKTPGAKTQQDAETMIRGQQPIKAFPSMNMALDAVKAAGQDSRESIELEAIKRLAGF